MHPHTSSEEQTLLSSNYGILVRTVVSPVLEGMTTDESGNYGPAIPPGGFGIEQLRPTLISILGYEPFLSCRVSADLEQPVQSATIRLQLGRTPYYSSGIRLLNNISPYHIWTESTGSSLTGPYWIIDPGRPRALFDTGIYIRLESKLVSSVPTLVIPPPPEVENVGPTVATTSPDGASVPWPAHSADRIGILVVQSPNQAVTLDVPAGFTEIGTAQGTGTAGTGGTVAWGNATEFTGTANPTTASHAAVANTKGVVVFIMQPTVNTDFVTGVTYGGVAMTRVGTQVDTSASGGRIYTYFLGSGIPSGTQTVNVARSQTTTTIHVVVNGIVAGATDTTEIVASAGQAGPIADQMLTIYVGGRQCIGLVAMESSIDNLLGSGTEPTGQERVFDHDFGGDTSLVSRRTTPDNSNVTMGWTMNQGRVEQMAVAVGAVTSSATRIHTYWCRATSNAMAAPHVSQPGDHFLAFIYTVRNALDSGSPINTSGGSVASSASTAVTTPGLAPSVGRALIVYHVAAATATTSAQFSNWLSPALGFSESSGSGIITYPALEKADRFTTFGQGGGIAVFAGPRQVAGAFVGPTATLATASVLAKQSFAISPQPTRSVATNPDSVPWRPFFVGRIDTVDPAEDGSDVLTLHCRDIMADAMDSWVVPDPGDGGVQFDSDQIVDLLGDLLSFATSAGTAPQEIPFAVLGTPVMSVPAFHQEPMSVLLAMRQAGLQNGWDLRGRWGTSPYGEDDFVLTYYEPDRALDGTPYDIGPSRYFEIGSFPLSRDDVRNIVEVIPSQPPRAPVRAYDLESMLDYGTRYMRLAYDKTSLIRTAAQAESLAAAVLSDVSRPKVSAEILTRFHPWIEVNDLLRLQPNNVHTTVAMSLAVSGYEHTLNEDGDGTTVIRTRRVPAAAYSEWRRGDLQRHIRSTSLPAGPAPEGAIWSRVRAS